jgi:hypothetical protein
VLGCRTNQGLFSRTLFFGIAQRRGLKKIAVAVAHRILLIVSHIIAEGTVYQERGGGQVDRRNPERVKVILAGHARGRHRRQRNRDLGIVQRSGRSASLRLSKGD